MLKRDYILDTIAQFGKAVASIIGLANRAEIAQAQEELQQTAEVFLGLSVERLEQEPALELLAAVRTGRIEEDISRWVLLVDLLRLRGDLYRAAFEEKAAANLYLKGLDIATEVAPQEEIFPYFHTQINLLLECLADYLLPLPLAVKLFFCYEIGGEYAAAEDLLFDLVELTDQDPAITDMGLAFYDRLWQLSDFRLLHGGLSREEVEESMGELLDLGGV